MKSSAARCRLCCQWTRQGGIEMSVDRTRSPQRVDRRRGPAPAARRRGAERDGAVKYNVITLDPPWPYERTHGQGIAEREYDLMTWDGLAALGSLIEAVAAPNCAIYLWTTAPLLMEITDCVRAWPFRYITKPFCWVKTTRNGSIFFGIGSYTASNTEDVWLLSNGTPRRNVKNVSQIVATTETEAIIAPMGKHSAKPEEMYRRVERLHSGPYLEIFARRQRPGWTCIGNELDGLDIRDSLARLALNEPLPVAVSQSEARQELMFSEEAA